jgi:hypothetical protein
LSAPSVLAAEAAACCEDEDWKLLPGWPHEISTCGRGRSVDRIDASGRLRLGAPLPQYEDERPGKGYLYFVLLDGKRRRKVHVAVAVLEAHDRPKPGPGWDACHGNHVRMENHLWNLSWDTHARNVAASAQRRRESVTDQAPETLVLSQEGRSPWWRLRRHLSRCSVTGDRFSGTGSFPFPLPFPLVPPPVNPSSGPVRSSRSSSSRRAA